MNTKDAQALELGAVTKRTLSIPVRAYSLSDGHRWKRLPHSIHYLNQEGLEIGYYLLDFPNMDIIVFDSLRHWSTEVRNSSYYEDESLI
jgi:hypothetical protein